MVYVFIFAASMILSAVLSRVVRDVANTQGWVFEPDSPRHVHRAAVPRLGGIAILAAVIAVVSLTILFLHFRHLQSGIPGMTFLGLLGPTLMIFALGLVDDFRPISPYLKFGVQILAALFLFLDGFRITRFQVIFGDRELGTFLGLILTVFWILLITNAFNLLDGLDGLAAGSALFSCIVVFIVSLVSGNALTQIVSAALAGAVVGFLRYNFKPATIFLGDCGSLVIGFLLGAVSLASSQKASIAVAVGIPVVSFGLPILDTGLAVLRRFMNGRPLFSPDGEHIHHKLLQRGLSQRQAVVVLYGVSALLALFSLFFLYPHSVGAVLAIVGLGVFFGLQHIGYHEVDELYRVARRTWEQKTIISNNLAIRRATAEMSKARGFQEVCEILTTAFQNNDFDGFGLSFSSASNGERTLEMPLEYSWHRQGEGRGKGWALQLDLISTDGKKRGFFSVFHNYSNRALRSDINCLNREFANALSAALERAQDIAQDLATATVSEGPALTRLEQQRLAG